MAIPLISIVTADYSSTIDYARNMQCSRFYSILLSHFSFHLSMQKHFGIVLGVIMITLAGVVIFKEFPSLPGDILNGSPEPQPQQQVALCCKQEDGRRMCIPPGEPCAKVLGMIVGATSHADCQAKCDAQNDPEAGANTAPSPDGGTSSNPSGMPANNGEIVPGTTGTMPGGQNPTVSTSGTSGCQDQVAYSNNEFTVTGPGSDEVLRQAELRCKNSVVSPPPCPGPLNICSQQGYVAAVFMPSYSPKYLGLTAQSGIPQWEVSGSCWYTRKCGGTSPNGTPVPSGQTPSSAQPKYCCSNATPSTCVTYVNYGDTCAPGLSGNIFIGDASCTKNGSNYCDTVNAQRQ